MPPKVNNVGFWGSGHVPKSPNHENGVLDLYNNEIGVVLYQSEAEKLNKAIQNII